MNRLTSLVGLSLVLIIIVSGCVSDRYPFPGKYYEKNAKEYLPEKIGKYILFETITTEIETQIPYVAVFSINPETSDQVKGIYMPEYTKSNRTVRPEEMVFGTIYYTISRWTEDDTNVTNIGLGNKEYAESLYNTVDFSRIYDLPGTETGIKELNNKKFVYVFMRNELLKQTGIYGDIIEMAYWKDGNIFLSILVIGANKKVIEELYPEIISKFK